MPGDLARPKGFVPSYNVPRDPWCTRIPLPTFFHPCALRCGSCVLTDLQGHCPASFPWGRMAPSGGCGTPTLILPQISPADNARAGSEGLEGLHSTAGFCASSSLSIIHGTCCTWAPSQQGLCWAAQAGFGLCGPAQPHAASLVTISDPPRHISTSLARSTGPIFFFCGLPRGGQEGIHATPAGGVNSAGAEHLLAPGAVPGLPAAPTRGVGGEQAP